MSDIRPFLAFAPRPARAFAEALTTVDVPVQPSPWSPKQDAPAAPSAPPIDVAAVRAEAAAKGREDGLAETAALRARLKGLVDQLTAHHAQRTDKVAELVADAACAVVSAWSGTDRRGQLAPILRAWADKGLGAATARVNPADVELLADSGLTIEADASIKPGELVIRNAQAELVHRWDDRLRELRETIVAALEKAP